MPWHVSASRAPLARSVGDQLLVASACESGAALTRRTLADALWSELSQPHASNKARLSDNTRAKPKRTNISITNSFQHKMVARLCGRCSPSPGEMPLEMLQKPKNARRMREVWQFDDPLQARQGC